MDQDRSVVSFASHGALYAKLRTLIFWYGGFWQSLPVLQGRLNEFIFAFKEDVDISGIGDNPIHNMLAPVYCVKVGCSPAHALIVPHRASVFSLNPISFP